MEKLGTALGIVTAAKLEAEAVAIEMALLAARDATKGFSQELVDMEAEGGRQMESLRLRAEGLASGLGDIGKEAANAALGFDDLGESAVTAGKAIDAAGEALDSTGDAAEETGENFDGLTRSVRDTNSALSDQASQASITRGELVQLTAVAETLALAEARTALAATQAQRGSIAARNARNGRGTDTQSSYALSQFGTGGRATLDDDGNLRPA
jgi:hypothetical protein